MTARGENSGEKAEYILFVALSFYSANLIAQSRKNFQSQSFLALDTSTYIYIKIISCVN